MDDYRRVGISKSPSTRPFLKWAGGKSQLLTAYQQLYPTALIDGGVDLYIEPFVGSGAVLLDVLHHFPIRRAVALDSNQRLIATYTVVKTHVEALIERLGDWQARYWSLSEEGRKTAYYTMRDLYNRQHGSPVDQAAQFIFLNRTCFNGLYRVNSAGDFNVPIGRYDRPRILDAVNLRRAHQLFQQVEFVAADYHCALEYAGPGAFVYCDPPYRPLSPTASFTHYGPRPFTDDDQRDLARWVRALHQLGALTMVSNSDPQNAAPDDRFFDVLYEGFFLTRVPARRAINSQRTGRGPIMELVMTNYRPAPH